MPPQSSLRIKWGRLALAIVLTIVIADTVPHPNLAPGVLQSMAHKWQTK